MRWGWEPFLVAVGILTLVLAGCGAEDAALGARQAAATPASLSFCDLSRADSISGQTGELLYVVDENTSMEERKRHGARSTIRLLSVHSDAEARETVLAGPDGAPHAPAWSPEGTSIAYIASTDAWDPAISGPRQQELFVMAADGSGVRQLTKIGGVIGRPAWSPDGTRLLFTQVLPSEYGRGESGIYVVNADGTGLTRVSMDDWHGESIAVSGVFQPRWTPDGSGVLYAEPVSRDDPNAGYRFMLASAHGSTAWDVSDAIPVDTPPVWSPDGCSVVTSRLAHDDDSGFDTDLFIASQQRAPRTLTSGPSADFSPAWSPDGETIAFVRMGSPTISDPMLLTKEPSDTIILINADGTNERPLTTFEWVKMMPPIWSPDGSQIAFVAHHYATETWELHVINADGTGLRPISENIAPGEVYPSWRPASVEADG